MTKLALCSACRRHVRLEEHACPHCGFAFPLATLAVAASLGLVACDARSSPGTEVVRSSSMSGAAPVNEVYGPPPINPSNRMPVDAGAAPADSQKPPVMSVYGPAPVKPSLRQPPTDAQPDPIPPDRR